MPKIRDNTAPRAVFRRPLYLAERVREPRKNRSGKKVDSLHTAEVECLGKGWAHKPYAFGAKASIATPLHL